MTKQEQGDLMRRIDHGIRHVVDREEEMIEDRLESCERWRNVVFTTYGTSHRGPILHSSIQECKDAEAYCRAKYDGLRTIGGRNILWSDVAFVLQIPVTS